jgi:hypothetical protein
MTSELLEVANANGEKYFTYIYNDTGVTLYKKTAYASLGGALKATYWHNNAQFTQIAAELQAAANDNGEKYFTYIYNDTGITAYKKTAYASQGGALKATYWYTTSGFTTLRAYLLAAAVNGEIYFAVETFDAQGRPTFVKAYSDVAGTVFKASYRMTYHGTTTRINQKTKYSDLAGTTLVATYTYNNDALNRLATELLVTALAIGEKYFTYICNYLHMSEYTYILEFRKV